MKEQIYNSFHFSPEPELLRHLAELDGQLALQKEEYSPCSADEQDALSEYQHDFLRRFTHGSSSIEGSTLSPIETALVIDGEFVPSDDKEVRDMFTVRGCYEGYDYMLFSLEEHAVFDEALIKTFHEKIALDCQPRTRGTYRVVPVHISGSKTVPVSPAKVREHMADLMFAYEQSCQHPIVKACAFHAMFEGIHPFRDGNGRVGRTVLNYMLLKNSYPAIAIKSEDRVLYLKSLEEWQTNNNPEPFIEAVIANISKESNKMIEAIVQTRDCAKNCL